jgi:hypothetical protein
VCRLRLARRLLDEHDCHGTELGGFDVESALELLDGVISGLETSAEARS